MTPELHHIAIPVHQDPLELSSRTGQRLLETIPKRRYEAPIV
jgi:hypothetical protein